MAEEQSRRTKAESEYCDGLEPDYAWVATRIAICTDHYIGALYMQYAPVGLLLVI